MLNITPSGGAPAKKRYTANSWANLELTNEDDGCVVNAQPNASITLPASPSPGWRCTVRAGGSGVQVVGSIVDFAGGQTGLLLNGPAHVEVIEMEFGYGTLGKYGDVQYTGGI